MNTEQINVAMAELDGLKWHGDPAWEREAPYWKNDVHSYMPLPPYTSSLDAVQRVFGKMTQAQQGEVVLKLWNLVGTEWTATMLMATVVTKCLLSTPLQWCEATLRATGNWKDTP